MDKRKFIIDVWGEEWGLDKFLPNVDYVISALPYREQIIIRLKYNGIPFTKIARLVKQDKDRWWLPPEIRKNIKTVTPSTVSRIYREALKKLATDSFYKRIWLGELTSDKYWDGNEFVSMGWNSVEEMNKSEEE